MAEFPPKIAGKCLNDNNVRICKCFPEKYCFDFTHEIGLVIFEIVSPIRPELFFFLATILTTLTIYVQ